MLQIYFEILVEWVERFKVRVEKGEECRPFAASWYHSCRYRQAFGSRIMRLPIHVELK